ncbi:uncharacterized protein LOC106647770 [Copidosoma floridanum]|uniref:uncharacterized protein LOC106647770 n=1 Tax=Copidosoma floridanum TaxID=29053 RepID=UPI0006C99155|nr:uncharacterized protein LOC106647770 [Copidosoma floridanum]
MQSQLCEKKCDCQAHYNDEDYLSGLMKMECHQQQEPRHPNVLGALRLCYYLLVLSLLGYSLWRIHEIEVALGASERYTNITRLLERDNLAREHPRRARSVEHPSATNALGGQEDKEGPRDRSKLPLHDKNNKPKNKEDFVQLVNALFDRIQLMHNDTDKSHFDGNVKALFQAWLPVFDTLLPREDDNRAKRSLASTEEDKKTGRLGRRILASSSSESSESSSNEDKPRRRGYGAEHEYSRIQIRLNSPAQRSWDSSSSSSSESEEESNERKKSKYFYVMSDNRVSG